MQIIQDHVDHVSRRISQAGLIATTQWEGSERVRVQATTSVRDVLVFEVRFEGSATMTRAGIHLPDDLNTSSVFPFRKAGGRKAPVLDRSFPDLDRGVDDIFSEAVGRVIAEAPSSLDTDEIQIALMDLISKKPSHAAGIVARLLGQLAPEILLDFCQAILDETGSSLDSEM